MAICLRLVMRAAIIGTQLRHQRDYCGTSCMSRRTEAMQCEYADLGPIQ